MDRDAAKLFPIELLRKVADAADAVSRVCNEAADLLPWIVGGLCAIGAGLLILALRK